MSVLRGFGIAVGSVVLLSIAGAVLLRLGLEPPDVPVPDRGRIVLDGVTVVNPGWDRRPARRIVIEGDRIVAIEPGGTGGAYAGRFALPGLIDMHTHQAPRTAVGGDTLGNLLFVANGVTTVRDTGEVGRDVAALDRRIRAGALPGPRIFRCGPVIDGDPPVHPFTRAVRNAAEARAAVDEIAATGVDCLKTYHALSPEALAAIRERAATLGLPVLGHVPGGLSLADASLDDAQHLFGIAERYPLERFSDTWAEWDRIDDDAIDEVIRVSLRENIAHTPTLVTFARLAELLELRDRTDTPARWLPRYYPDVMWSIDHGLPRLWQLDAEGLATLREALPAMRRLTRRLYDAGVRVHVGSDCFMPFVLPGIGLHDELREFVALGLTPEQAFELATRRAGEALEEPGLGTLAPGAPADVLLFREDPTRDLSALASVELVVADGRAYSRDALDRALHEQRAHARGRLNEWLTDAMQRVASALLGGSD